MNDKPVPLKNSECEFCLEESKLLMPVQFAPGFPEFVWARICLACRMEFKSDKDFEIASDMLHSKHLSARNAHAEWSSKARAL